MNYCKIYFGATFILSFLLFLSEVSLDIWVYVIFFYFTLSIINFIRTVSIKFPFGEFISFVFFIENTFAVTLIYVLKGDSLTVGTNYYSLIPLGTYIPFSFIAGQALLLGYLNIKNRPEIWRDFVKNFNKLIDIPTLFKLLIFGIVGSFLSTLGIASISYITYILLNFFSCALIGYALFYKKLTNIYLLVGLAINFISAIKAGMFGSLIYFAAYYILIYIIQINQSGKKINFGYFIPLGVVAIWMLALLQNVKGDYREAVWTGQEEATSQNFFVTIKDNLDFASVTDLNFYLPLLFRLNQGYQVSAVMQKVPTEEPFANGSTIVTAIRDAFVPRFLNPDKEEAGGRRKIPKFTNLVLVGSTSMNIGLLGESFANFGQYLGILFLFFYGMLIAKFERAVLIYSLKKPIILVLFPIFFESLVGSGTDFLMVFNSIVKSLMFLVTLLYFFERTRDKKMFNKVNLSKIQVGS